MELTQKAEEFLKKLLSLMGVEASFDLSEHEDSLFISLNTAEPGLLIGRRGETLDALQYLLNIASNKGLAERQRIVLDVEGYRAEKKKSLEELAKKTAEQVISQGLSIALEPMNPFERRIVHMALLDYPGVETTSEGEEPYRKVTIFPKKEG